MADIKLDGHRPRGHLAERMLTRGLTLRQLIAVVRTELLYSSRYLSSLSMDGRLMTREELTRCHHQPVEEFGRLEIISKPLPDILLPPFEHAVQQIQTGIEDIKHTMTLLADGQEAKACEHLASQIGVWPLMIAQYEKLLTALQAVGWPADDFRGLEALPAQFSSHVAELRELLAGRDFSAIVVFLSGPVAATHRQTLRTLGYLKNRIQKPRRRRKPK
jgi:hypothetical protein